jgi:hypothetical protein
MKYGPLAENSSINTAIYDCFHYISVNDQRKFVKEFRHQPHDQDQVMHTFRELILGAYLASRGLKVSYHRRIDGKTPDWIILNDDASPKAIVELTNFHIDRTTEDDIKLQVRDKGSACYWVQPNNARLYQRIQEKSDNYRELIKKYNVAYVVAIFSEFTAGLKREQLHQCLFQDYGGLFSACPTLSGVLFFKESAGSYVFEFIENPHGVNHIVIA